jgi:hypothetical protein
MVIAGRLEEAMEAKQAAGWALAAALALAGQPALASGSHHGGGGHSGGSRPSGGHAATRGGGSGRSAHPAATQARHPQPGTSRYATRRDSGGHYRSYSSTRSRGGYYRPYSHGRYYRGYYRPYYYGYGGYYGGYYGPYASFYFGWPYSYASGWWPYGWVGGYDYDEAPRAAVAPEDRADDRAEADDDAVAAEQPPARPTERRSDSSLDAGRLRLEVRPDDAAVYVDDEFWGNAHETKVITLRSGRHTVELVRPGFEVERREVDVVRGRTSDVLVELTRP